MRTAVVPSAMTRQKIGNCGSRAHVAHAIAGVLCFVSAIGIAPPKAFAQESGPTVESRSVAARARPEFDPIGVRLGSIFFYPQAGVAEEYNDNIFATQNREKDDLISVISPSLTMRSDWGRHAIRGALKGNFGLYKQHDSENYNDVTGTAGGRVDITSNSNADGDLVFDHLHEDRSSPDDVGGKEPTTYNRFGGNAAFTQRFNRLTGKAEVIAHHLAFDDVPTTTGTISNGDRNRYETEGALRLSYEFIPSYAAFVRGAYRRNIYEKDRDRNGFDRNSEGYKLDTGVTVDVTGLLSLEARLGYLSTDFDDTRLKTVNGASAGLLATWNVTPLTTIKANADRDIQPTTLNGASAEFDTSTTLTVDHELLRNLIVSGIVGYTRSDFDGISRGDNNYEAGAGAKYLIAHGFSIGMNYRHDERSSNAGGASFGRNVVMVRATYGL